MGIQGVGSIIEYDFQGVDTVSFLVQVVAEIHFVIIIIMGWFNIIYMGIDGVYGRHYVFEQIIRIYMFFYLSV